MKKLKRKPRVYWVMKWPDGNYDLTSFGLTRKDVPRRSYFKRFGCKAVKIQIMEV